jgi:hypothetical protein
VILVRLFKRNQTIELAQPVGMRTLCLAGWHRTLRYCLCQALLSVTYSVNTFGNPVASTSCVGHALKLLVDDRNEEKSRNQELAGIAAT